MLYHGNKLINEVYHGSTKIGEIYHGSTLVYQSKPKLKLYGWHQDNASAINNYTIKLDTTSDNYVLGDINTYTSTFNGMSTGSLGEQNSQINILFNGQSITLEYWKTADIKGAKVHFYSELAQYSYDVVSILDKSEVGAKVLFVFLGQGYNNYPFVPTAISSNSMTFNGYTNTRDSTLDFTWTTEAIS